MDPHAVRIVFWGTPEFAAASLEYLLEHKFKIVAVVSTKDKPAGRGHRIQASAVSKLAKQYGLPLIQPESLTEKETVETLRKLAADLYVVVAFQLLPEVILQLPRLGAFNLHASLLPAYRGAAPIQHAILNGEDYTGVTTFKLTPGVDKGPIYLQRKIPISMGDNAGSLHDKLMLQGRELVALTIEGIANGSLGEGKRQNENLAKQLPLAPKISKTDTEIRFREETARDLLLRLRAFTPYPATVCELQKENNETINIKLHDAQLAMGTTEELEAGQISTDQKTYIRVGCKEGAVELLELQLPAKKRMSVADFLNGYKFQATDRFS